MRRLAGDQEFKISAACFHGRTAQERCHIDGSIFLTLTRQRWHGWRSTRDPDEPGHHFALLDRVVAHIAVSSLSREHYRSIIGRFLTTWTGLARLWTMAASQQLGRMEPWSQSGKRQPNRAGGRVQAETSGRARGLHRRSITSGEEEATVKVPCSWAVFVSTLVGSSICHCAC